MYRGLSPALLRHVFYTSIRIVAYENLRNRLSNGEDPQNLPVAEKAFIGGVSGIIGQVIESPADLVKVRMQANGRLVKLGQQPRYTGMANAFTKIAQSEGVKGLWRGVGPNAQRAFLVNIGELACYDQSKQWITGRGIARDNIGAHTLASVASGLSAKSSSPSPTPCLNSTKCKTFPPLSSPFPTTSSENSRTPRSLPESLKLDESQTGDDVSCLCSRVPRVPYHSFPSAAPRFPVRGA